MRPGYVNEQSTLTLSATAFAAVAAAASAAAFAASAAAFSAAALSAAAYKKDVKLLRTMACSVYLAPATCNVRSNGPLRYRVTPATRTQEHHGTQAVLTMWSRDLPSAASTSAFVENDSGVSLDITNSHKVLAVYPPCENNARTHKSWTTGRQRRPQNSTFTRIIQHTESKRYAWHSCPKKPHHTKSVSL